MLKGIKNKIVNGMNDKVYTKFMDAKIACNLMNVSSKKNNKIKNMKKETKGIIDKTFGRIVKGHENLMNVNDEEESDIVESTCRLIDEASERIVRNHEILMKTVNKIAQDIILDESTEEESDIVESTCRVVDETSNDESIIIQEPEKREKTIDEIFDELIEPTDTSCKKEEDIKEGDIDYIINLARMLEDEELENEDISEIIKHRPIKEEEMEEMFNEENQGDVEILNMDEAIKLHFQK